MGVNLERDEETGLINMKQPVLINRAISDVGIDYGMAKVNYTPASYLYEVHNKDGVPDIGGFKYSGFVGILSYLSDHTCP